ncbi:MAG: hypothetical protein OZ927_07595 [Alcaligenaceae bacterium]|nr:hypothetical protein [Alcaligenaceae bacterium]
MTTAKRPDRAKALKHANEAAAYDAWLRKQVQASIDDPRPSIQQAGQFDFHKSCIAQG